MWAGDRRTGPKMLQREGAVAMTISCWPCANPTEHIQYKGALPQEQGLPQVDDFHCYTVLHGLTDPKSFQKEEIIVRSQRND